MTTASLDDLPTGTIHSIADVLRTHAERTPDRVALILDEREQTWGELLARSSQVANGMAAAGVGAQDRVAFLDKNGIEHFEVFYGASLLNAVCVDVNWRLAAPEVEFIVNDAEAKVLVVGPDFVPILDAIGEKLNTVAKTLVIGAAAAGLDYDDYDEW
ncbi:MAG: AMP-binding protein, partial [Actinomycetota bacterium]